MELYNYKRLGYLHIASYLFFTFYSRLRLAVSSAECLPLTNHECTYFSGRNSASGGITQLTNKSAENMLIFNEDLKGVIIALIELTFRLKLKLKPLKF